MKKRGQALVEFVIILPIFIFMLLAIIDTGKIIYYRNTLESTLTNAIDLYYEKKEYNVVLNELKKNDKNVELELTNDNNEYVTFEVKKPVTIITPGLNLIFGTPYQVNVKRVVHYE